MNKLKRINRIIKFANSREVYYDDKSKSRPHLVAEFNNKENKIGTLYITTQRTSVHIHNKKHDKNKEK